MSEIMDVKVLYVEDTAVLRRSVQSLLQKFVREVTLAEDGIEGLKEFRKNKPDIIITDIQMPNMDGIEMIKRIKVEDDSIPIIVITSHEDSSYLIQLIELGINTYVLKPTMQKRLVPAIKHCYDYILIQRRKKHESEFMLKISRTLLENAPSHIYVTNINGVIEFVNERYLEVTNLEFEEVISNIADDVSGAKNDYYDAAEIREQLLKGEDWKGVLKQPKKNGEYFYESAHIIPLKDSYGNIIQFMKIALDLTPLKLLEAQIEFKDKQIERFRKEQFGSKKSTESPKEKDQRESLSHQDFSELPASAISDKISFGLNIKVSSKEEAERYIELLKKSDDSKAQL